MTCHVELVYDADCPNVEEARAALRLACAQAGVSAAWVEWDRKGAESPAHVRSYGSPTILVNGRDVADTPPPTDADCCRVYMDGNGSLRGVPSVAAIAAALLRAKELTSPDTKAAADHGPEVAQHRSGASSNWRSTVAQGHLPCLLARLRWSPQHSGARIRELHPLHAAFHPCFLRPGSDLTRVSGKTSPKLYPAPG